MTLPAPIVILAAAAAFVAIGPWVKVATAKSEGVQLRALSLAATLTAIMCGLFVFGVAVSLVAATLG